MGLGMTISEPTTMITDYLLAGLALICGFRLWKLKRRTPGDKYNLSHALTFWRIGFFSAGAAAIVGGTFHGFRAYQRAPFHWALWHVTVLFIAATATSMVAAAFKGRLDGRPGSTEWLQAGLLVTIIGLTIEFGRVSIHPNFNYNDLYHCTQAIALYFFYRGARGASAEG
jgi:hypothetical protein